MKIIIGGAMGRMGKALAGAASEAGVETVCGVDVAYAGQTVDFPMVKEYAQIEPGADVLIDFSRAEALLPLLARATEIGLPLVLCATGYQAQELAAIDEASKTVPIFRSANMSLGVNLMRELAVIAARVLGDGYDVEIIEKHHRQKQDSPSGTALMLYEALRAEKGGVPQAVYGRNNRAQKRTATEIGIHAVRGGTVTGEHEVGFYGNAEEILISHRAEYRGLFAEGALRAARFLVGKPAGMYDMKALLQENLE